MKKILSLLLTLAMVLTLLAGCQRGIDNNQIKTEDPKIAVEAVLNKYMNCVTEFNFAEASTYTTNPDILDKAPFKTQDEAVSKMLSQLPDKYQPGEEGKESPVYASATVFFKTLFDKMKEYKNSKVIDIQKKDENTYVATLEITMVDAASFDLTEFINNTLNDIEIPAHLTSEEDRIIHIFGELTNALQNPKTDEQNKPIPLFTSEEIKTAKMAAMLKALGVDTKALVVTAENDNVIYKSTRNIKNVTPTYVGVLNTYEVLKHNKFIASKEAIEKMEEVLA